MQTEYFQKIRDDLSYDRLADLAGSEKYSDAAPEPVELSLRGDIFKEKCIKLITVYRLMDICVVEHAPGKSVMTLCNLWRLTKYADEPRIFLHEFSFASKCWREKPPASVQWNYDSPSHNIHSCRYTEKGRHASWRGYDIRDCAYRYIVDFIDAPDPATWPNIEVTRFTKEREVVYYVDTRGCFFDRLTFSLLSKVVCEILRLARLNMDGVPPPSEFVAIFEEMWLTLLRAAEGLDFKWRNILRILRRHFLDRDIMSAMYEKNLPDSFSLAEYLRWFPHASNLLRIANESRNALPLLELILPQHLERRDILQNPTLREICPPLAGLNDTQLRLLRKLPGSVLNILLRQRRIGDALNLLRGMQLQGKIPAWLLGNIVAKFRNSLAIPYVTGDMPELQRIYRLYARHCLTLGKEKGNKELTNYLRDDRDISKILDWFLAEGRTRRLPAKNATWGSLKRMSDEWHAKYGAVWKSLLEATDVRSIHVRPLTSLYALTVEGKEMRHCVASYASRCLKHNLRIFSLTENSGARSTLSIHPTEGNIWKVYEHRGVRNGNVSRAACEAASELCRLYAKAEKPALEKKPL